MIECGLKKSIRKTNSRDFFQNTIVLKLFSLRVAEFRSALHQELL